MVGKYLIESQHTLENCLPALDEILAKDPSLPEQFDWGCNSGEHTGWMVVRADSESEARDKLPDMLKDEAHIVELNKFTAEEIKKAHDM